MTKFEVVSVINSSENIYSQRSGKQYCLNATFGLRRIPIVQYSYSGL